MKILDFGLARVSGDNVKLTQEGAIVGTPAYMAPEQARSEAVDGRCDLFSLGAVLYRACTGVAPFTGKDTMAVLLALATEQPKPPCEVNPKVPRALSELILRLLAKDRERRPRSAAEVAKALATLDVVKPRPPRRRRPLLVAVAARLLLAAVGISLAPIVIRIKGKDGKETVVEAPEGSKIAVNEKGEVQIDLPREKASPDRQGGEKQAVVIEPDVPLPKPGEPLSPTALVQRPAAIVGLRNWSIELERQRAKRLLALRPDGQRLAISNGNVVHIRETASRRLVQALLGQQGEFRRPAWSPNGRYLAAPGIDYTLDIWDADKGRLLRQLRGVFLTARWSPDGRLLATGGNGIVQLWEADSGTLRTTPLKGHQGYVHARSWSPDGKQLASGGQDRLVRLWDVVSGNALAQWEGHTNEVYALDWSPDGQVLASGALDRTVRLCDVRTGKLLRVYEHTHSIVDVAWRPGGSLLASSCAENLHVWEASSGKVRWTAGGLGALCWMPDGRSLVAAGHHLADVRTLDAVTGQLQRSVPALTVPRMSAVAWSLQGDRLASSQEDGLVSVWQAEAGRLIQTLVTGTTHPLSSLGWSPDGSELVMPGSENAVLVWNATTGQRRLTLPGHQSAVRATAWSPDGKWLVSASDDRTLRIWDAVTGKPVRTLTGHAGHVNCVAWSPDSRQLASGGYQDVCARVWDAETGETLHVLSPKSNVRAVAWSPDGWMVATAAQYSLQWWEVASGKLVETLKGHRGNVRSAAWSPDGKWFASSETEGAPRRTFTFGMATLLSGCTPSRSSIYSRLSVWPGLRTAGRSSPRGGWLPPLLEPGRPTPGHGAASSSRPASFGQS